MHGTWVGAVGFVASVVSLVMWWPQALRVWQGRRQLDLLTGVSVGTQVLLALNAALWAVYALATHAWWVGAPSLVNGPLAIATIVILRRHPRPQLPARSGQTGCDTCGWDSALPHRIFVTVPPGYGSLVGCSSATARLGRPVLHQP